MENQTTAGFGSMVIAVVCPPLYFFMRGKVAAGVIHSGLYFLALVTLIFGIGIFFWFIGFFHAYWDLAHLKQEQVIQRQATVLAEKLSARTNIAPPGAN